MIKRVIIAFAAPRDYVNPKDRQELTSDAMERVKSLHKRITVDYYRNRLGEVIILSEPQMVDDLHAILLAEQFKDHRPEIGYIVGYEGLCQEMEDFSEDNDNCVTVIIYLHTESEITTALIKNWNEMFLFTRFLGKIHHPASKDHLAVIIDRQFPKIEWVRSSTMHSSTKSNSLESSETAPP